MRVREGDGKLHALVGSDRAAEHNAAFGVRGSPLDEPATVADALRRDEDALGIEPVEQITEAHAFFTHQVFGGNAKVSDEELWSVVVEPHPKRLDLDGPR